MYSQRFVIKYYNSTRPASSTFSPQNLLSTSNREKTIAKFMKMKAVRLQPFKPAKIAAVLIPICVIENKVSLLYTLRGSNMKTHRGQVSFPGGMKDDSDKQTDDTALRETYEELGISKDQIDVWGVGNHIVARGKLSVFPVIGFIKGEMKPNSLKINPSEVSEAFTINIEDLCNPKMLAHTQFRQNYSTPVFLGGKIRVWGLTAIITHMFLQCFLPFRVYTHTIKHVPPVQSSGLYY